LGGGPAYRLHPKLPPKKTGGRSEKIYCQASQRVSIDDNLTTSESGWHAPPVTVQYLLSLTVTLSSIKYMPTMAASFMSLAIA
jgi:hypothetical protein